MYSASGGETGEQVAIREVGVKKQPIFYAVDVRCVNIDDLLSVHEHPGRIVRCEGNPADCIVALPVEANYLGTWKCLHCDSVMTWKLDTDPPRKCWSCGAPRKDA
jgi:hypothetical protein